MTSMMKKFHSQLVNVVIGIGYVRQASDLHLGFQVIKLQISQ